MKCDDTASAYGLFQVVFADVTVHLAVAAFRLRERKEPGLAFETIFRLEFKQIFEQFRRELCQFDGRSPVSDNLHALRKACEVVSTLAVWRNDRIHAQVHMTEHGYALYNWRTRSRLELTFEQINRNIELAIFVICELEAHVPRLVDLMKWDDEIDELLSALPELSKPPELYAKAKDRVED
jgi:hypothetical protein